MSRILINLTKNSLPSVPLNAASANLIGVTGALAGMEMSGLQTTSMFAVDDMALAQQAQIDRYTKLALSSASGDELALGGPGSQSIDYLNSGLLSLPLPDNFSLGLPISSLQGLSIDRNYQLGGNALEAADNQGDADEKSNQPLNFKELNSLDKFDELIKTGQTRAIDPLLLQEAPNALRSSGADGATAVNAIAKVFTSKGNHDVVDGTSEADTLIGSLFADTLIGHSGDDIYWVQSNQTTVIETLGGGYDRLFVTADSYKTSADIEYIQVVSNSANYLMHNQSPDSLLKNIDVGWHIYGNSSDQTLVGGQQSDVLNGLGGYDTLIGGAGNDVYSYSGTEKIIENDGNGLDTVKATSSYKFDANIENAVVDSNALFVNLTGNSLDNILVGNSYTNTLSGGDGNDTLVGAGGEDLFIGGSGADTFVLNSSDAFAGEIYDFQVGQDKIYLTAPSSQQGANLSFSDSEFHGVSGEVLLLDGMVEIDWDGDAVSDMLLLINTLPDASDFYLMDPTQLPGI